LLIELFISDIKRLMLVMLEIFLQLKRIPLRRGFGAKEILAHVVVDSHNLHTQCVQKACGFTAN